jgi:hypothetical protein
MAVMLPPFLHAGAHIQMDWATTAPAVSGAPMRDFRMTILDRNPAWFEQR